MPVQQTLGAYRTVPWAPTLLYAYEGPELTLGYGSYFHMYLRLYPGAADPPLVILNTIPATSLPPGAADGDPELWSVLLEPAIAQGQLVGLPGLHQPEAGDPQVFAFDIRLTYADGFSEVFAYGDFVLYPGVTNA